MLVNCRGVESRDEKLARVGNSQKHIVATPVPSSCNYSTEKEMQDYEVCTPMSKPKIPSQQLQQSPPMPVRLQETTGSGNYAFEVYLP